MTNQALLKTDRGNFKIKIQFNDENFIYLSSEDFTGYLKDKLVKNIFTFFKSQS